MSFILESLNKSEKKREDALVPNLHTVHERSRSVPKKRPLWPYLLVAVLLLNAAILYWFLVPGAQPPPVPVVVAPVDTPSVPPQAPAPAVIEPSVSFAANEPHVVRPAPTEIVPLHQVVMAEAPRTAELPLQAQAATTPPPVVEAFAPAVASAPPLPPPAVIEAVEPSIYAVADLPNVVQRRLPELQVSVYAYSDDPESRLVRVNNRILREGSYLDAGLQLEEISPTELIFAFEGYRFRVPKQ